MRSTGQKDDICCRKQKGAILSHGNQSVLVIKPSRGPSIIRTPLCDVQWIVSLSPFNLDMLDNWGINLH